jgi:hypothetical protein
MMLFVMLFSMPVSVLLVSELIISGQNKQVQFVVFVMMIETIYNTQNLTVGHANTPGKS